MRELCLIETREVVKVHADFVYPPIPDRRWDWSAVTDDYDGEGSPCGHGRTEPDAITDLLEQLEV